MTMIIVVTRKKTHDKSKRMCALSSQQTGMTCWAIPYAFVYRWLRENNLTTSYEWHIMPRALFLRNLSSEHVPIEIRMWVECGRRVWFDINESIPIGMPFSSFTANIPLDGWRCLHLHYLNVISGSRQRLSIRCRNQASMMMASIGTHNYIYTSLNVWCRRIGWTTNSQSDSLSLMRVRSFAWQQVLQLLYIIDAIRSWSCVGVCLCIGLVDWWRDPLDRLENDSTEQP